MLKALRSYISCLKSSRMLGKADKLVNAGRKSEAENILRESLKLLSMPHIVRRNPAEASLIITSTLLLEEIAAERGAIGASDQDIFDSLNFLQEFSSANSPVENYEQWLAYLQHRIEER